MKLYSFFNSSTSYRVRIALALKGLEYEYLPLNIRTGIQDEEAFSAVNPMNGVPVLEDDDFRLTQSMAILQYLDDKYPEPKLLPQEIEKKAQVLSFCQIIASDMHPINNLKVLKYLVQKLNVNEEQKTAWYQHWITKGFTAIERKLEESYSGNFCFGDELSLADVCLIPQYANAQRMGCDLDSFVLSKKVFDKCLELDAFKKADPKQQPDFIA
ncbi:Uncharacterized GST-like protein yfcF [Oligella ureolytica]|nr:Uncharacterized GST-like protein yfcF [Oligella ureolytica]